MPILILIILLVFICFFLSFLNNQSHRRYYRPLFVFPQIILMLLSGTVGAFYLKYSNFGNYVTDTTNLLLGLIIISALISIIMGFRDTGIFMGIITGILTGISIASISFIFYGLVKVAIFLGPGLAVIFLLVSFLKKSK